MPEAEASRINTGVDRSGPSSPIGKDGLGHGPRPTLNNGRGCVVDACAFRVVKTADGTVVGTCEAAGFLRG